MDSAPELLAADRAFQAGDLADAERHCRNILDRDPQNPSALHLMAVIRQAQGQQQEAIDLLKQVVDLQPSNIDALLLLSDLLRTKGQIDQALQFAQQALQVDLNLPEAFHSMGLCCLSQQRLPQAAGCFQRASRLNPRNPLYPLHLGIANHSMGNFSVAATCYRHAISLDPGQAEPHVRLGLLLIGEGKREEAISHLHCAVEINPSHSRAHTLLAQALNDLGREEEVAEHLRQAAENGQGDVPLGLALQEMGRFEEASAVFEQAIAENPLQGAAYQALAKGRRITESDRPLIDQMLQVANLPPDEEGLLHFALGKAFEDLGEFERAMRHYDKANATFASLLKLGFDPKRHAEYIDDLTRLFTRDFFNRNADLGSDSELPIFVVGMIRSGTTLVEQILSSHPQIGAAGEIRFWIEREEALLNALRSGTLSSAEASEVALEYRTLLRNLAPKRKRVTDKMPLNFMLLGVIHTLFPSARIVHCRRDQRDNCLSIYTTHFAVSPNYAHSRENLEFYHREYQRLMAHWRQVLPPEIFLEIDYEELVSDRETVTRRLIAHTGLQWDDACLHPERNRRNVTTPSAWQVRQPVYRGSVGRAARLGW